MVDLGEKRTRTGVGVITKPKDAGACAAVNHDYLASGREHSQMPNVQPKKNVAARSKRRESVAIFIPKAKSRSTLFIESESALEALWSSLEPAVFEQFATYRDGQIPKKEPISAIDFFLRYPHAEVDPHLSSIGLSQGLVIMQRERTR